MTELLNHAARKHHKYGMSKLNALDYCAGYMSDDEPSEASADGTRLHEIMDRVAFRLRNKLAESRTLNALHELREVLAEPGSVADENEVYYLEDCCKELDAWLAKGPLEIHHEIRIYIYHPDGTELNHGHLDILLVYGNGSAVLIDWKFGWIPVPKAEDNLQGLGYSAASFQGFPYITKILAVFVQPKLHKVTRHKYERGDVFDMYLRVKGVIARVEDPNKTLRPSPYCDFCANLGTCTAMLKSGLAVVTKHDGLPLPDIFDGEKITTAEQAAVAAYVIHRLEALIEHGGAKAKALEFAKAAGGRLEIPISEGRSIVLETGRRKAARSANSPALIADVLKDVLTPEQVLGCCDPSITKLEEVFADSLTAQRAAEANEILRKGEEASESIRATGDKKLAASILKEAKEAAKEAKLTKKAAYQILNDTLLSEGLMSAPTQMIDFLKVRLEKTITANPLIENAN